MKSFLVLGLVCLFPLSAFSQGKDPDDRTPAAGAPARNQPRVETSNGEGPRHGFIPLSSSSSKASVGPEKTYFDLTTVVDTIPKSSEPQFEYFGVDDEYDLEYTATKSRRRAVLAGLNKLGSEGYDLMKLTTGDIDTGAAGYYLFARPVANPEGQRVQYEYQRHEAGELIKRFSRLDQALYQLSAQQGWQVAGMTNFKNGHPAWIILKRVKKE